MTKNMPFYVTLIWIWLLVLNFPNINAARVNYPSKILTPQRTNFNAPSTIINRTPPKKINNHADWAKRCYYHHKEKLNNHADWAKRCHYHHKEKLNNHADWAKRCHYHHKEKLNNHADWAKRCHYHHKEKLNHADWAKRCHYHHKRSCIVRP
ncbi:uncharacterized histidine-rich protein DDB_G0274557-like isoform X2 [Ipomoea triloba]|uniref:uncharacterized histidine-rich protein DDB_G0274557-like isoform X2 n=1 Tax=Ipomoea triloba TaxID=35885 RepID=UPI00125E8AFB|nr:uncharacterized histidine-rich protein DDB_G0274557-like isoform X2 [Ipomoea triloba]